MTSPQIHRDRSRRIVFLNRYDPAYRIPYTSLMHTLLFCTVLSELE
jgi:hypothetical protein